jgi:hypothetical protein
MLDTISLAITIRISIVSQEISRVADKTNPSSMPAACKLAYLCVLTAVALTSPRAVAQQLTVQTVGGKQMVLSRTAIEGLPHVKVQASAHDVSALFEGVPVRSILEKAGVGFGDALRGKQMSLCLLAEATDNYKIVIALPEMDPAFTDKQIILAFSKDGKPLDAKEGPYRIVIPDEKRPARWIRQVTTLKIVNVQ